MKKLKIIAILMIVGLFAGCEVEPEEEDYIEPHNTSTGSGCGIVQGHYKDSAGNLYLKINDQYFKVTKSVYDMVGDGREMCL